MVCFAKSILFFLNKFAEVSERFKVQPWKGCVQEIAPRVRISSSAPNQILYFRILVFVKFWKQT